MMKVTLTLSAHPENEEVVFEEAVALLVEKDFVKVTEKGGKATYYPVWHVEKIVKDQDLVQ